MSIKVGSSPLSNKRPTPPPPPRQEQRSPQPQRHDVSVSGSQVPLNRAKPTREKSSEKMSGSVKIIAMNQNHKTVEVDRISWQDLPNPIPIRPFRGLKPFSRIERIQTRE